MSLRLSRQLKRPGYTEEIVGSRLIQLGVLQMKSVRKQILQSMREGRLGGRPYKEATT